MSKEKVKEEKQKKNKIGDNLGAPSFTPKIGSHNPLEKAILSI